MAQDPWAEFEEIRPVAAQPRRAPQPVISLPDPDKQADNARADRGQANSDVQTGIAVRSEGRAVKKDAIDSLTTLQGRYESLQPVKDYRAVLPQFMQALQLPDDPTADNTLLYAYAKVMDPGSVVRESEQGAAASGASYWDQAVEKVKKQFNIGGNLTPEVRARLKRDIETRVQAMGKAYRLQRERFADTARRFNIDPADVIGPDDFDAFREEWERQRAPKGQANQPTTQDVYGGGVQFNMDTPDRPFDRAEYLRSIGVPPEKEDLLVGFWSANSGNQRLTPEAVTAWYQANGITPPDPQALAATIETARKMAPGTRFGGIDTSAAENAYRERLRSDLSRDGFDPTSGGAYGARAIRGAEMGLTDELEGIGGAVEALFSNQGVADGYRLARDRTREAYSQMEDQQGGLGTAAELAGGLAGGLALPSGAARGVAGLARQGAIQGAVAGYGYGEGLGGSLAGAVTGAGIGMAGGALFGKAGDALAARAANRGFQPSEAAQNYASGQKFGIDLSLGDAGGMSPKIVERILDVQPGAGSVMNAERNRLAGQIENAVGDVAGSFGQRTSFAGMGETAQTGARNWMDKFQRVAAKVYDAIPIKPKVEATADNTRTALAEITKGFESNPELSKLWTGFPQLRATLDALTPTDVSGIGAQELTAATQRLSQAEARYANTLNNVTGAGEQVAARQEVEAARRAVDEATQKAYAPPQGGQVSWEDMKRLRSIVGQIIGKPSLNSDGATDKAMRGFYEALSRDMEATAASQGPAALKAFQRANSLYREGQARIDGALTRLLGKRDDLTPEKAASVIQAIAKDGKSSSDLATLADIRKSLKPDEWGQVSSGFIELLGHPANAAGREFSPNTFITNFKNMAPEAKNLLFGGENKALRQNLDEFVKVMDLAAKNNATRNTSNTAMGLAGLAGFGAAGGGVTGALALATQAATSFGAAKLWTHPAFVRWATGFTKMEAAAARSGQINQSALQSQMSALSRIAANDNAIAADVAGLQQELMGLFAPARSAATPPLPTAREEKTRTQGEGQ